MKVVFRVDGSSTIGQGHVMRCLSLAHAWRDKGAEVVFVSRELPGFKPGLVEDAGFEVRRLAAIDSPEAGSLGCPAEDDVTQTHAASGDCDWLVVDHYGIDRRWEARARKWARRILAISDGPGREHDVDALLDPTLGVIPDEYSGKVEASAKLFLGPSFALLRPEFARLRGAARPRERARRLLVGMGGADPKRVTLMLIEPLSRLSGFEIKVVVGPSFQDGDAIRQAASRSTHIEVLGPTNQMADLMAWADLMIGAGGSSSWERCCLGLPSLVILTAENQRHICKALEERGIAVFLGPADALSLRSLQTALRELQSNPARMREMSQKGLRVCDGLGANRLVKLLRAPDVRVRPAVLEDSRLLYGWANHESVRSVSFSSEQIDWNTHEQWFAAKLVSRRCVFLIGEVEGAPVGQIRFDNYQGETVVSVNTAPEERGRGAGSELIRAGTIEFLRLRPNEPVIAFIRLDNAPSVQAFLNAGYVLDGETDVRGVRAFRYRFPV